MAGSSPGHDVAGGGVWVLQTHPIKLQRKRKRGMARLPFPFIRLVNGRARVSQPRADRIQFVGFTETKVRPPVVCLKETVPSALANKVWSLPMPTLTPGWNLVPRWRTRMLPASTSSAPNFLTPRRRPAVSRPLRDEPPAFLCAIRLAPYSWPAVSSDGLGAAFFL